MKYRKIMLINPSNTMLADSLRRVAPPMGLLYIGAVLKKNNYNVKVLDSSCEGYFNTKIKGKYVTYGLEDKEIIKHIENYKPDVVGISSMFSSQWSSTLYHCNLVKKVNKNIITVVGGIHPSLFAEDSIKHKEIDYVIIGEGEYRLLNLLNGLNKNEKPNFDGVAYKKAGKIFINPMTTRIENLDAIPFPDYSLIDFEKYISIGIPYSPFFKKERVAIVSTSRGCPYHCCFCSTVKFWGKFRIRSVENILEEIDFLIKKYKIEEIQFSDDNMTINRARSVELFKKLKGRNIVWCTQHGLMAKTLDEELLNLMADSGAYQLTIAIESGSERVLKDIIHKPVPSKERIKELIGVCHKRGVGLHSLFVVGFPGETREEIEKTLNYPFEVGFDSASFFIANPMPGSELHDICKNKGYLVETATMDLKNCEINIPKNNPDFFMDGEELEKLVDKKTHEMNEYFLKKSPEQFKAKFEQFLKKHPNMTNQIMGRVT